jgi:aldehyde:ferredoxin oxidoreductase
MKFLIIDMSRGSISEAPLPEHYALLGGRALSSALVDELSPADCDPLGEANTLVFAPGLLGGTPMPNTGRLSVGAKSPLTGGIKESNVGGTMAEALSGHGIRALIVRGKAPEGSLFHLHIDEAGAAKLVDASNDKGMRTYALTGQILSEYGKRHAIACIGPAGEAGLKSASVQVTDPDGSPSRAAARGGLGAVMGAKGLKALIVSKKASSPREIADGSAFKEAAKAFAAAIKANGWSGQVLPQFGTASILANTNASGALPTRNASQGSFPGADKINGDTMAETIKARGGKTTHKGCSRCIINCSNVYVDEAGQPITSALEYETIFAMGAMPCIDDLDVVARLDFLCDDIGLDTINTGAAVAVAMDAGAAVFGDGKAALAMVEAAAEASEIGSLIGHGPDDTAKHYGHARVPTVKGQSIAGYDPRAMPGMGVTYATSPMGADHTAGFVGGAQGDMPSLMEMSKSAQIHSAAVDSMGLCMFAQSGGLDKIFQAVSALIGRAFGQAEWQEIGTGCLALELDFNRRAGLTEKDDALPAFFKEEPLTVMQKSVAYPEDDLHGTLASLKKGKGEGAS